MRTSPPVRYAKVKMKFKRQEKSSLEVKNIVSLIAAFKTLERETQFIIAPSLTMGKRLLYLNE